MKKTAFILAAIVAASGCTNMQANTSKTGVYTPKAGDKTVVVQANANMWCKDYVFFRKCFVKVEQHQIADDGQATKPN